MEMFKTNGVLTESTEFQLSNLEDTAVESEKWY